MHSYGLNSNVYHTKPHHTTEDFKRAAKAVSGVELKDHLVRVIFLLFDRDGMV